MILVGKVKHILSISVEVEVLWVVLWGWELWFDGVDKLIIVLSVDEEVEEWLHVSSTHGNEVEVDNVPGVEHDWGVGWVHPLLLGQVNSMVGSNHELALVLHNNLVLMLVGNLNPVFLDGCHLVGVLEGSHLASKSNHLWDLVSGVVLHLSELVVLSVELDPGFIIDINDSRVVWALAGDGLLGGLDEVHVGLLKSVGLGHVSIVELLDLWSWSGLLQMLDELDNGGELIGMNESLSLSLELLSVVRALHHLVIFHGLSLERFGFVLKWLDFQMGNGLVNILVVFLIFSMVEAAAAASLYIVL